MISAKRHDQLHAYGTYEPYGPQRINGHEHPKRCPLGQESKAYKKEAPREQ